MYSLWEMQSTASNLFAAYASVAASMMLFRSLVNDVIPEPIKSFFFSAFSNFIKHVLGRFFNPGSALMTLVIDQNSGLTRNQIYAAAEIYVRTLINIDTERVKVSRSPKQKNITVTMEKNQTIIDWFQGIKLKWQFVLIEEGNKNGNFQPEKRFFELTFEKSYRDAVLNLYLPYVSDKAKEIKEKEKQVKLYTRDYSGNAIDEDGGDGTWGCINLDHPITFDKLGMDPDMKKSIIQDLDRFLRRRDYYKKVGKAWKRGYLLYGPPGTGKSSLIAAIANYLKFDVYDLELTSIYSDSELRRILLSTNNRSIIVVEDIDCSAQMHDRIQAENIEFSNNKLTLSGLLNFIDGLWSACGDERIVIFTTNHKDKLDPALLRPGRMDMHIHMGYCTPEAFDILAFNYLGINEHSRLFPEIKGLIREVEITPAEIAEHLMRNENVDLALEGVVDLLRQKKEQKDAMPEAESDAKERKSIDEDIEEFFDGEMLRETKEEEDVVVRETQPMMQNRFLSKEFMQ